MLEVNVEKEIYCGKSRRKTNSIRMSLIGVKKVSEFEYNFKVVVNSSIVNYDRNLKASSEFDCLNTGLAFFRQALRFLLRDQPNLKFYEEVHNGELLEMTINEIFGTQDCVPEDLQIGYEWALKNGYEEGK